MQTEETCGEKEVPDLLEELRYFDRINSDITLTRSTNAGDNQVRWVRLIGSN